MTENARSINNVPMTICFTHVVENKIVIVTLIHYFIF